MVTVTTSSMSDSLRIEDRMVEAMCLVLSMPWSGEPGWTATACTAGFSALIRREVPIRVAEAPIDATKWSPSRRCCRWSHR
ncbi:hypothetical protein C0Z10_06220 [Acidipropionibacterium jensenii]|uniref:Uncharacterized protein n=1 Tax=Acidipropionibacterium jensenii TaxID=1749 RepID=A0A3T0RZ58_9ACTN|nr:hypothetical protein C0Z10_06220 [Acidipropionibacterium jensenii]